jgi:tRNA G10  N-methylase Trm11
MSPATYLFVLGRTPKLAFLELQTLFPRVEKVTDDIAMLSNTTDFIASDVMNLLGGTTKIVEEVGRVPELTPDNLSQFLASPGHHIEFGISCYGTDDIPKSLAPAIKRDLKKKGISARYVAPKHGNTLSTVSVDKSGITELVIVKNNDGFLIGITVAVQPFESWGERDYGRPFSDPKSGMLPPKVARMIVNIARAVPLLDWQPKQKTLLDPFCGMGTILAEGYMTGWRVMGSDSSADVVIKAQKNLAWLISHNSNAGGGGGSITVTDATHVSEGILPHHVDAIVTEPFMGATNIVNRSNITSDILKNIIKGLEKLYIGCLREWTKILVPNGLVILALPSYTLLSRTYFVNKVVDMCEILGYTIVVGPIEYSRPQAIVKREFYVLKKKI